VRSRLKAYAPLILIRQLLADHIMDAATAQATPAAQDGLEGTKRLIAFLVLSLGIVMAVLDGTIVNVALPYIALDQNASASDAIWVVSAYQLAVVVGLLPVAALGEAIGFRKVLAGGLVVFTLASLLCAYSNSILMLTLFRILQGLGGAAIMGVNGALIRFITPSRMLGRGLSSISVVVAVSGAAGPTIAAAILAVTSWHWLFLINVPIGIICIIAGQYALPLTPTRPSRFDIGSALLNVGTFGGLIAGLSGIGSNEMPLWLTAVLLAVSVASGYLLVMRQRGRVAPLLPVDLFRIPAFALSIVASITSFSAQFLATVTLPFFLIHVLGYDAVATGLLMTPWPAATAVVAPIAGRFADRVNSAKLAGVGSTIFAFGLLLCALLPSDASAWDVAWRLALCGFGFGLFQTPNNKAMISSTPRDRSGGAGGMQSTARVLGQSFGSVIATLIFAFTAGYDLTLAMAIAATLAMAAAVLSIWR
jgi:DHA2 family multidrug resistance protein-like MFS transporter